MGRPFMYVCLPSGLIANHLLQDRRLREMSIQTCYQSVGKGGGIRR